MIRFPRHLPALASFALLAAASPPPAAGQGIVIDQGQFEIRIDGRVVGTEDFVVRRASLGQGAAFVANGTVTQSAPGRNSRISPLLRALPPDGQAESYQVDVTGDGAMELRLARSGRRYVATIRSDIGAEDRELQARPETRILDRDVAHHHYFLRDVRTERPIHVLEPRTRSQHTLTAVNRTDEELRVGPNTIQVRRVDFESQGGHDRTVWFDRQGRVVRVSIPALAWVAERTDLVG
ncbi:MAG: hypothetical protein R3253_12235 [Longimicrobiales bacterium]|nr:hypothetical protein [Longimicrobiales bacterium]